MNNKIENKDIVINVIGGGLAGVEACWRCLNEGFRVNLYEMKPTKFSPAHSSEGLAELVCSNSLKSKLEGTASGILKQEMVDLNSLVIDVAYQTQVPAGGALAVDRKEFSKKIEERLNSFDGFKRINKEVDFLPTQKENEKDQYYIVCTGPLSSQQIVDQILKLCNLSLDEKDIDNSRDKKLKDRMYFYDALSPIIETDSIDLSKCFHANRYHKGENKDNNQEVEEDYLNIALSKEEYEEFVKDLKESVKVPLKEFEDVRYFESCLPIEVMAERGLDTLRFGPLKPVGIIDPRSGKRPWANIQLRAENKEKTMYNIVGFQTKMNYASQKKVLSKIPGLEKANFLRLGSIHRNTYINSPLFLEEDLSFRCNRNVYIAGQIIGVEGYIESASMGILAGLFLSRRLKGKEIIVPYENTIIGELLRYVTGKSNKLGYKSFSPMNANMGLLSVKDDGRKKIAKDLKNKMKVDIEKEMMKEFIEKLNEKEVEGKE